MLDGYRKLYGLDMPNGGMSSQFDGIAGSVETNPRPQPAAGSESTSGAVNVDDLKPPVQTGTTADPVSPQLPPSPGASPQDSNAVGNRGFSENSMLPVVAESLKRATDSASASIDSILRAMQDTKEALSSTEIKPDLSEFEIDASKAGAGAKSSKQNSSGPTTSQRNNVRSSNASAADPTIAIEDANIDKAMDSLMNKYIQEIESPLRGVLFGSVVTAALIQMQKIRLMLLLKIKT